MASRLPSSTRGPAGTEVPPLRVAVVDDHPIVRRGLVDLINAEPGLTVCGEAATAADAMTLVAVRHPDVAIVDLLLGNDSGLDLVGALRSAHPDVRVLVLSGHDERLYADRALRSGALGYIMKDQSAGELLAAIRRVGAGRPYVSEETAERILTGLGNRPQAQRVPLDRLSDRERHVLTLVGRGLSTRDIAAQLGLSVKTVESHFAHIKEKLAINSGRDLVRFAITWTEGNAP